MRPVWLGGGAAVCVGGHGVDALRDCVMAARPQPARVRFHSLGREIDLPYQRVSGGLVPEIATQLARQALEAAELAHDTANPRLGLFIGTSSGGISQHEQAYLRALEADPQALAIYQPDQSKPALAVHRALGLRGPHYTVSTACSSSGNALLYAAWAIREGRLDAALVVGLELENRLSQQGFHALMLATREVCRPFDARRDGIVLGETAVALVLTAHRPANARWRLRGGATLCDTTHPTNPSAAMIAETMRRACADAGVERSAISAIKAHGTGTRANDEAEGLGMREVFGERMPPLTSLKPALGHTLGACGALETLAFTASLDRGRLPPTAGFEVPDPALGLTPLCEPLAWSGGPVLLNTFGFGGNNCALILQREDA